MDALWTILILTVFTFALYGSFRRGADDSIWELRWRSLDAGGRARIATAAQTRPSRAETVAPEELEERELVAGYRRRQRRRRAYIDLAASPFFLVAAALMLAGLLPASLVGFLYSVFFLLTSLVVYLRERQMDGRLRAVVDAEPPAA